MYTHYGRVGAIPTYRVYRLSDMISLQLTLKLCSHHSTHFDTALFSELHCSRNSCCFDCRIPSEQWITWEKMAGFLLDTDDIIYQYWVSWDVKLLKQGHTEKAKQFGNEHHDWWWCFIIYLVCQVPVPSYPLIWCTTLTPYLFITFLQANYYNDVVWWTIL